MRCPVLLSGVFQNFSVERGVRVRSLVLINISSGVLVLIIRFCERMSRWSDSMTTMTLTSGSLLPKSFTNFLDSTREGPRVGANLITTFFTLMTTTRRVNCRRCGGEGRLRSGGQRSRYFQCDACQGLGYKEVPVPKSVPRGRGSVAAPKSAPAGGVKRVVSSSNGAGSTSVPPRTKERARGSPAMNGQEADHVDVQDVVVQDVLGDEDGGRSAGATGGAAGVLVGSRGADDTTSPPARKKRVQVSRDTPGQTNLDVSINCTYIGQLAAIVCVLVGIVLVVANKSTGAFLFGVFLLLLGLIIGLSVFGEKVKALLGGEGREGAG